MTNPARHDQFISLEQYLEFEDRSSVRHEYVGGRMHAMAGVTREHSRIVMNIGARLWAAARGGPCRVHQGEIKLRVGENIFYPDVISACGGAPRDRRLEDLPSLLFEVISPTTERTDRGEKVVAYRGIPSLQAYVIVEQERRWVDRHWREPDGQWQRESLVESGTLTLSNPSISLTLDEIYEGVELPTLDEYLTRLRLREEAASYG